MAADFVVPGGDLKCMKTKEQSCGTVSTFTAQCTEGSAIVDLYTYDGSKSNIFGQEFDAALTVPDACNPTGDNLKTCHFRFVLNCMESCVEETELGDTGVYLRGG
uniref:Uncharacterized protein n=2 Tax=Odontella aurita TaxID=265563 RepID=A0A7S4JXR7_9STRA|mmetsp:Transcript_56773/g.169515  ORF Transcript_56773/g.169515 Transcript_56773/m.169515 type:complete len:105 (+) Transcript_56773:308-622(+)